MEMTIPSGGHALNGFLLSCPKRPLDAMDLAGAQGVGTISLRIVNSTPEYMSRRR